MAGEAVLGNMVIHITAEALDRLDGKNVSASITITTSGVEEIGNVNLALQLQEGGEFWANQPTLIMVGEGGQREHVSVTQESRMGEGRGDTIIINDRLAYKMWKADQDRETRKRLEGIL